MANARKKNSTQAIQKKLSKASSADSEEAKIAEQLQVSSDLDDHVEKLEQRHQAILKLGSDVMEMSELFKDLRTLVDEQDGQIDQIAKNIESVHQRVEDGKKDLDKAEKHQRNSICVIM